MINAHKAASNTSDNGEIHLVCLGLLARSMAVPYSSPTETIVAIAKRRVVRSYIKGEGDLRAEAIKGTLELEYPCQRPQLSGVPWSCHGSFGLETQSSVQDRNSVKLLQQFP